MHYRNLQAVYTHRSESAEGDLSALVSLSREAKSDLFYWINRAKFSKGRKILISSPLISIYSDASLSGWGAMSGDFKTGGPWIMATMNNRHINELELLAAFNGLKCFASSAHRSTVKINIDNTTAVSYIREKVLHNTKCEDREARGMHSY